MTPAWDALLETFERSLTAGPVAASELESLVRSAIADRTVDAELDPHRTARLLAALADGTRALPPTEADQATALLVATRWLHPPRLRYQGEDEPRS